MTAQKPAWIEEALQDALIEARCAHAKIILDPNDTKFDIADRTAKAALRAFVEKVPLSTGQPGSTLWNGETLRQLKAAFTEKPDAQ